jgi:hypothetical protein
MGLGRSLNFGKRILFAVFPFHGFFGVDGRAGLKAEVVGNIDKNNFAVIRVNARFHKCPYCR